MYKRFLPYVLAMARIKTGYRPLFNF